MKRRIRCPRQRRNPRPNGKRQQLHPPRRNPHQLRRQLILPNRTPCPPHPRLIQVMYDDIGQHQQQQKEVIILQRRLKLIAKQAQIIQPVNAVWPPRKIHRTVAPRQLHAGGSECQLQKDLPKPQRHNRQIIPRQPDGDRANGPAQQRHQQHNQRNTHNGWHRQPIRNHPRNLDKFRRQVGVQITGNPHKSDIAEVKQPGVPYHHI